MNERIEKLIIEAFFDESTNGPDEKMYTLGERKMQLFAELIVQKCAGIIESQDVDPGFKLRMSWAVKKHFGIEES